MEVEDEVSSVRDEKTTVAVETYRHDDISTWPYIQVRISSLAHPSEREHQARRRKPARAKRHHFR